MTHDIIWDVETFPNVFTLHAVNTRTSRLNGPFEISDWRNDSRAIIEWVMWLKSIGARMVGFNSIGFTTRSCTPPVAWVTLDAKTLYDKAMAIIGRRMMTTAGCTRSSRQTVMSTNSTCS